MLKAILQIIITILASYFVQMYLPFWSLALIAGVIALFFVYRNSLTSFAAGFLAAFILWCAFAYTLDSENFNILSNKMGLLFKTEGAYLPYATGLIGGMLGGFGALTGALLRKIFENNKAPVVV